MVTATSLAHHAFGTSECQGILNAVVQPNLTVSIVCQECETIFRTVPLVDLSSTLDELELIAELLGGTNLAHIASTGGAFKQCVACAGQ